MGSTRARTPKNFVLDERLERYAQAIEPIPAAFRGRWLEACTPLTGQQDTDAPTTLKHLVLDLGCGKGSYLVAAALANPDTLFIGVDAQPVCIAYAAQRVVEAGVPNALLIPGNASRLHRIFGEGELDGIILNFPTPHPRSREAEARLTTVDNLMAYRRFLKPGGSVTLRTDSEPLFDFSLPQFRAAGFDVLWTSHDVRADHPQIPMSEYEERLAQEGARVHGIGAQMGLAPDPFDIERARETPRSLYNYIPDDLYEGAYIPHGMGYAINNFRNRRRNAAARAAREER